MQCVSIPAGRHRLPPLPVWGIFLHLYWEVFLLVDEAFPVSLGLVVFFSFPLILLGKALGSWGPHHYCNLFLLTDELSHVIQPLPWFLQHDNGEKTYLTELRGLKRQYTWKWSLAEPWAPKQLLGE